MSFANLERAFLNEVILDETTVFRPARFALVGLRATDFSINTPRMTLNHTFGDQSVELSKALLEKGGVPRHWSSQKLTRGKFLEHWRDWQAKIGYKPPER